MTNYYKEYLWREFLSALDEIKVFLCLAAIICVLRYLSILGEESFYLVIILSVVFPRMRSKSPGLSSSREAHILLPLSSRELFILKVFRGFFVWLIFYIPIFFILFDAQEDLKIAIFAMSIIAIGFSFSVHSLMQYLPHNKNVSYFVNIVVHTKYYLAAVSSIILLLALFHYFSPTTRNYNFTFSVILFQIIALSYMYVERDVLFFNEKRYKTTERFVFKRDLPILSIILIACVLVGNHFQTRMNQKQQEIIHYEK